MAVPSQMTEANTIYLNVIQFIYPFVIMLFAAIVLGALDLWLYNKYVESKANNN